MKESKGFQCRQGDIYFEAVNKVPAGAKPYRSTILAYGEVTGHAHRISSHTEDDLTMFKTDEGDIYIKSPADDISVSHEEHGTITVPHDEWIKVYHQREYDPLAVEKERRVAD